MKFGVGHVCKNSKSQICKNLKVKSAKILKGQNSINSGGQSKKSPMVNFAKILKVKSAHRGKKSQLGRILKFGRWG